MVVEGIQSAADVAVNDEEEEDDDDDDEEEELCVEGYEEYDNDDDEDEERRTSTRTGKAKMYGAWKLRHPSCCWRRSPAALLRRKSEGARNFVREAFWPRTSSPRVSS